MPRKTIYLYRLNSPYQWDARHFIPLDVVFKNEWLSIEQGIIMIAQNYAWDGCSPKWSLADLWIVGTPDGRLQCGLPITYYASLVHDALTQFRHMIPITHHQATSIFNALLKESGFSLRSLYVMAISLFGPRDFLGNRLINNKMAL